MIVPNVWVQIRVPGFKEKSLVVITFETNDPDVCKVHVMPELVDMACVEEWSLEHVLFL